MAICKEFRELEEIHSLGSSAPSNWTGICDEECDPFSLPTSENGRIQAEMLSLGMIEKLEDWNCGFCRYTLVFLITALDDY